MRKNSILIVCILLCSVFAFAASDLQRVIEGLPERGDGAFLRKYPNGFRIFGVGTAVIDDPDDGEAVLRAEQIASMNARKAISEYMSQTLSGQRSVSKAFEKAEQIDEAEGETTKTSQKMSLQTFSSEISSGTNSIMRGVVTIKTMQIQKGKNTFSRVLVGYSSKTLNALQKADENGVGNEVAFSADNSDSNAVAAEEKAEEWLLCIGHGKDRNAAIRAAIIEGVQQVYGAYLENSETYKSRFAKLKASDGASEVSEQSSSMEKTQETLTQTKGFVDAYRIVSVEAVAAGLEAKIKAKFINPRAGGLKAIMVYPMSMPLSKQTNVYTVAPKKKYSGKELGQFCERKLERAFSKENKYLVLNIDDMQAAIEQHNLTKKLVEADKASPAELSKVGKMLTADYILNTSFGDYAYTRKMGLNNTTKKLENIERVVFTFDYSIFEVKTGERRKQNTLKVVLDNQAIAAVRAEDEQCNEDELATKIFEQTMKAAVALLAEEVKF